MLWCSIKYKHKLPVPYRYLLYDMTVYPHSRQDMLYNQDNRPISFNKQCKHYQNAQTFLNILQG
jgi:hypothetical protein